MPERNPNDAPRGNIYGAAWDAAGRFTNWASRTGRNIYGVGIGIGHDTDLGPKKRARFIAAGGEINPDGKKRSPGRPLYIWQGVKIGRRRAFQIVKQIKRGRIPATPLTPPPVNPNSPGQVDVGSGWGPWLSAFYSLGGGPIGPRKRFKKRKKRKLDDYGRPIISPDEWGGLPGGAMCGTDADCARWDQAHGTSSLPGQAFVGDFTLPDIQLPPEIIVPGGVLTGIGRILPFIIPIFWPSKTADDDVIPGPGPVRRRNPPYHRPGTTTDWPVPDFPSRARPRKPPKRWRFRVPNPQRTPDPLEFPLPTAQPLPVPRALPRPSTRPASPRPAPSSPAPTSTPSRPLSTWLDPLTYLLLQRPNAPSVGRVRLPSQSPVPIESPLTSPFAYGVPSRLKDDQCDCTRTRKRKKSTCTNPITSKRTRTRGGRKFRTITRRLDCS
jgi:hypothetical protein